MKSDIILLSSSRHQRGALACCDSSGLISIFNHEFKLTKSFAHEGEISDCSWMRTEVKMATASTSN